MLLWKDSKLKMSSMPFVCLTCIKNDIPKLKTEFVTSSANTRRIPLVKFVGLTSSIILNNIKLHNNCYDEFINNWEQQSIVILF